jgi:DNA-binding NarL/FixJ family response regulator
MGKKVSKSEYEDRMISTMREIVSEFEDEIEIGEIATTHKITIKTVYRILNKYYGNDEKQKFEALLQKQIIRLYEEGVSKSEIGKRFGLSSVSKYIDEYYKKSEKVDYRKINEENERIQRQKDKKEKKEFMLAQKKEIEEQNKEIIRLYENGAKQKEIAEMFGLKRGTVADRINRYYSKSGENRNVMLDKAIIDGLAKGKAQTAIAKEIGKSRKTVSRIINRLI